MLEMQQTPSFQINYHNPEKYINGPEKNIFLVQNPFLFFFFFFSAKSIFYFFVIKHEPFEEINETILKKANMAG